MPRCSIKLNLEKKKKTNLSILMTNTRAHTFMHCGFIVPIVADYPIESIYPLMLTYRVQKFRISR